MRGTPEEVAARLYKMPAVIQKRLRDAEAENVKELYQFAQGQSSGPYKQDELTRMGHPYSRRAPNPPLHPGIINVQSGAFRAAWRRRLGSWGGGRLVSQVSNVDRKAAYMYGTVLMIARRIDILISRMMKPRRIGRLRRALKEAIDEGTR